MTYTHTQQEDFRESSDIFNIFNRIESKSLEKEDYFSYFITRTPKSKNYQSHFECASYSQEVLEVNNSLLLSIAHIVKNILLVSIGTALC